MTSVLNLPLVQTVTTKLFRFRIARYEPVIPQTGEIEYKLISFI